MGILGVLLALVAALCWIGSLVCFILVLVKMFQNNETTMGIVCIVTALLCGIGGLIAFILGWINSGKWQIQKIMIAWTGCWIGGMVLYFIAAAILAASGMGEMNVDYQFQGV